EDHFTRVVREGGAPEDVAEAILPADKTVHLPALLVEHLEIGLTSEARRMIAQGGVKVNGEVMKQLDLPREALSGALVQAGKRRFIRFRAARHYPGGWYHSQAASTGGVRNIRVTRNWSAFGRNRIRPK